MGDALPDALGEGDGLTMATTYCHYPIAYGMPWEGAWCGLSVARGATYCARHELHWTELYGSAYAGL